MRDDKGEDGKVSSAHKLAPFVFSNVFRSSCVIPQHPPWRPIAIAESAATIAGVSKYRSVTVSKIQTPDSGRGGRRAIVALSAWGV
jgi:hypothetical protein